MSSVIVNEYLAPCTLPDGSPGQVSLIGQISRVQNIGVTYDVAPSSTPSFSLAPNTNMVRASGAAIASGQPVTINVEQISSTKYKLTFSGDGAPNGLLLDGAYKLKQGTATIGTFNVCYGAREETVMVRRVVVDKAQADAFTAVYQGDVPYDAAFDFDLDSQVKNEDLNQFLGNNNTLWVNK